MNEMEDKDPAHSDEVRDPEDRPITNEQELREKMLDKTLADSFPTSDPPSTIPDPAGEDSLRLVEDDMQNKDSAETLRRHSDSASKIREKLKKEAA
jgi:hypothetical protein